MGIDTDQRLAVAQQILDIFRNDHCVKGASLRGSLLDGCVDAYSDIDIRVDVSGCDNAAYCQTVIETMERHFDLHFHDWRRSLMPQSYVLAFFIKGLPIFWNIDLECSADPHHPTLTRDAVTRDVTASLLKLWALNAKYILRRLPGVEQRIQGSGKRALGVDTLASMNSREIMGRVLANLTARAQPQLHEFAAECQKVYERQLIPYYD